MNALDVIPVPVAGTGISGQRDPASTLLIAVLREVLGPASVLRVDEPLARRTTLRVGGNADLLVEPADETDLARSLAEAARLGVPWRVIGRGSNLLVKDGGFRGLILSLQQPAFARLEVDASTGLIRAGAGVRLKDLANAARRHGLAGLEFLAGIPGSVGGALRMNAGAWNGAIFERLVLARLMGPDGAVHERNSDDIPVTYRRCDLFKNHLALSAHLRGDTSTVEEVEARLAELNQKRWATQPAAPSAGCIFKNPKAVPAGRLVDELGLKGTRIGGAVVSTVHGNFIVNDGGATAADILALIELIRRTAHEKRGIDLETEVEILGD